MTIDMTEDGHDYGGPAFMKKKMSLPHQRVHQRANSTLHQPPSLQMGYVRQLTTAEPGPRGHQVRVKKVGNLLTYEKTHQGGRVDSLKRTQGYAGNYLYKNAYNTVGSGLEFSSSPQKHVNVYNMGDLEQLKREN